MHKIWIGLMTMLLLLSVGCGQAENNHSETAYVTITAEEAKEIMDGEETYTILDVRTQEEYDQGHIGTETLLIPYDEIETQAEGALPDKEAQILVYCRTGRRSKIAAESLASMGYTNVKEFGGIEDWPYEIES